MNGRVVFSFLVPSYNRPELILEAVNSLLANAGADVEIIVSDDASPKKSAIRSVLSDLIEEGRIRYLQQERNLGWSNNRNALVQAARGEFVILMGDDDRLKGGALARVRHWMAERPGADLYGFGFDIVDADGVYHYCRRSPRAMFYEVPVTSGWEELYYWNALQMWSHHGFTMCFRRELALQIPYQKEAGTADDGLFLLDALQQGKKLFVIPESLFEWRRVESLTNGYINLSSEANRSLIGSRAVWCNLLRRPDLRKEVRAVLLSRTFIRRNLLMKRSDSDRLSRIARELNGGEISPNHPLLDLGLYRPETFFDRAWKLCRITRLLGWHHLAVVLKNYIDRGLYRLNDAQGK